jgi:hypothetical protein
MLEALHELLCAADPELVALLRVHPLVIWTIS